MQKESSPRRGGSFFCDPKEGDALAAAPPGSPRRPRLAGVWPRPDEDRPLSQLKESDRCSARENLYLDALTLEEDPEEAAARGPQRELRSCLPEVGRAAGVGAPWPGGWRPRAGRSQPPG